MKEILIDDSTKSLHYRTGKLIIKNDEGKTELELSLDQLTSISIFGNPQISTQLIKALAIQQKAVHYFSQNGKYIASSYTSYPENYEKQSDQFKSVSSEIFRVDFAKKMIKNKISLQAELLKAFNTDKLISNNELDSIQRYVDGVEFATSIEEILGYEGKAAQLYFFYLSKLVPKEFSFKGRTKNPPKDPFNSLLSYGYANLYGYLRGAITKYGLNIGFGCIHKNRAHHAALVSDLMEEWRPVMVDEVALKAVINNTVTIDMFEPNKKGNSIYLTHSGRRAYLQALSEKKLEKHLYFTDGKRQIFPNAINLQVESLCRAFADQDASLYEVINVE